MARKVEYLKTGSTFHCNGIKCHVVGFCNTIEDGQEIRLIVYKFWLKYKGYWRYDVIDEWQLQMWFDEGPAVCRRQRRLTQIR